MTDFDFEIRCRFQGQIAQDLKNLQELGNFPSLKATAEHIIGTFAGSMLKGLRQAQDNVEESSVQWLLIPPTYNGKNTERSIKNY